MTRYLKVEISQALFTTLARGGRAAGFLAQLFSRMEIVEAVAPGGAANWRVVWGCDLAGLPGSVRAAVEESLALVQSQRPLADFDAGRGDE
ncbi:hypothetical protein [Xylophilus sp.]|uniref:hypothetical protein n=1 Tax=Xylophilus sp. TaxID=2653893 RepID=UPI0013BCD251|nr:hypothetical protein [Xylophilus sp.]KAF1045529.1 MAG: hypothetical protein GAK38_02978 [Xylophilus sp.]